MKKAIFAVLFLVLLSGCANVPGEVIENMQKYNTDTRFVQNDQVKYSDAAGLFADKDIVLNKNYQNIIMPKQVSASSVSSIPIVTFQQVNNFDQYYKEIMALFFDKKTLSQENIIYSKNKYYNEIPGYYFDDSIAKRHAVVDTSGAVTILKNRTYDDNTYKIQKQIHIDRGEESNESFQLSGHKYSVKNAVQYVEKWIEDNWKKYEPEFTFRVKTITVKKANDKNYLYEIRIEKLLNDIPLDESCVMQTKYDEKEKRPYFVRTFNYIDIQMFEPNTIDSFHNDLGNLDVKDVDSSVKQYISFRGAAELVEQKLSGFKKTKISDIRLKYILCPKYDYIGKLDEANKNAIVYRTQQINSPGITVTSRPVWAFIIDASQNDLNKKHEKTNQNNFYKYIYVDAITGEIEIKMD